MNLLAFDTSMSACSIATQKGMEIKSVHHVAPMQQARLILPMIDSLLKSAALTLDDLNAIAYSAGPGSFTGIRLANSVAQGLGFAKKIPLMPISSLRTLAQAAYLTRHWSKLLVALDARMGQVYFAKYVLASNGELKLIDEEQLCTPEEILPPHHEGGAWYGVGDGWLAYAARLVKTLGFEPIELHVHDLPTGDALLTLAKKKYDSEDWVNALYAKPIYLR